MFKNQLQEYAQKAGLPAPIYDIKKEGPSHEPQFKASVTLQGEVYESPSSYNSLKKAEHAAAEVALASISKSDANTACTGTLHESGLCKNLLQEYAQKCKFPLPVYSVLKIGESHSPTFTATVEIAGAQYTGGNCKTKKEAEIKAARTALVAVYANSGASFMQAIDNPILDNTASAYLEATSAEPKSGAKRKKKLGGGSKASKAKVNAGASEKTKETTNGDALSETDNAQVNQITGSSSLLDITMPPAEGLQQLAAAGNSSFSSGLNCIEQPSQSPQAQEQ